VTARRPWKRLKPRDLFHHPDRVAVTRSAAGCFASDGVVLWDLAYWEPHPVVEALCDHGVHRLRSQRSDRTAEHSEDLALRWQETAGTGPGGCFQARCTPWDGRGFSLWAVPHPEYGAFPLAISDTVTETLRGQCFRLYTASPRQRYALITCGYDTVGAVRPVRFDPGDDLGRDATLLSERFRSRMPHRWPEWGPV